MDMPHNYNCQAHKAKVWHPRDTFIIQQSCLTTQHSGDHRINDNYTVCIQTRIVLKLSVWQAGAQIIQGTFLHTHTDLHKYTLELPHNIFVLEGKNRTKFFQIKDWTDCIMAHIHNPAGSSQVKCAKSCCITNCDNNKQKFRLWTLWPWMAFIFWMTL